MAVVYDRFASALKKLTNGDTKGDLLEKDAFSLFDARVSGAAEPHLACATAQSLGLPFADDLDGQPISHEFVTNVPIAFARRHGLIGLAGSNGSITVALADLAQWPQLEALGKILDKKIDPVFAPRKQIIQALNSAYQQQAGQAQQLIDQLDGEDILRELDAVAGKEDLLDVASRAPVIKLVNLVLLEAVKRQASDVHIQPYEDQLVVRFRIDGILRDVFNPPAPLQAEIISRIKVMGGMNIAEHRLAQDGRATVEVGDRAVDLRISTLPTSHGERAVIRLLDKSVRLFELGGLGMPENDLAKFRNLIHADHGIVLVTGPTGSGKTTTLYAALQEINAKQKNILTLEDPIEYTLDGISQTQIATRKGMTFASGLRHVLRQDPDIIMVGEIRDSETARMAIQSALTGHLVFSTLHTNDAAGAVTRMTDLGVEPYLLASSLLGVLAQRLIRKICPECRAEHTPSSIDYARWNIPPEKLAKTKVYKGTGCPACLETGYRGRRGVFELLTTNEPIREAILKLEAASSIKQHAVESGMTTLRETANQWALEGITSMDEVARVTSRDDF